MAENTGTTVWVITEDLGYDCGTVVRAVAATKEAVQRWKAEHCHPLLPSWWPPGTPPCDHRGCFDVDEMEVVE